MGFSSSMGSLQERLKMFDNELEVGGRYSTRAFLAEKQGKTRKPYRDERPKEKRKPDYTNARKQKRGETE